MKFLTYACNIEWEIIPTVLNLKYIFLHIFFIFSQESIRSPTAIRRRKDGRASPISTTTPIVWISWTSWVRGWLWTRARLTRGVLGRIWAPRGWWRIWGRRWIPRGSTRTYLPSRTPRIQTLTKSSRWRRYETKEPNQNAGDGGEKSPEKTCQDKTKSTGHYGTKT